jgi:A/G-specific adenine glycosylase
MSTSKLLTPDQIGQFQNTVYDHYREHGRDLPWRHTTDPYRILVSEIMLQQTQVERVIRTYGPFIERFPDVFSLAAASVREVLTLWQGMGYNRRAISLLRSARIITFQWGGTVAERIKDLTSLPGVGRATASALLAFSFDVPTVFIETNIRRVFIHHFFVGEERVSDGDVLLLVEETLDRVNPRKWYYALMDYGSTLKSRIENPNRKSTHYRRQTPFAQSDRKIRGAILRMLLEIPSMSESGIMERVHDNGKTRVRKILAGLKKDGLIAETDGEYQIA